MGVGMKRPNRKFYSKLAADAEREAVMETLRLERHIARIREYNRMIEDGDYKLAKQVERELTRELAA